ncbi:MAG: carboxylesterase [Acidiferrobacteraceae bacterium]|nr:carboxylesterase [Acidiferrobacteraceae bacterium]|tara:strand:+ start:1145 stop:1804 length:660 start_codon:yes stop_codon:yes gene_type:complete
MPLEHIKIDTGDHPACCVIWLHGLGADGHDFVDLPNMLKLPPDRSVRYIFPHAPVRPITLNGGVSMRGWYDLLSLDLQNDEDAQGLEESSIMLAELIDEQVKQGISTEKILLGGFSQGGALSLYHGLCHSKSLAGLVGLSTYLPLPDRLSHHRNIMSHNVPIFMGHGCYDSVIPSDYGKSSRDILQKHGYTVTWRQYPMDHSICESEIQDMSNFLLRCF